MLHTQDSARLEAFLAGAMARQVAVSLGYVLAQWLAFALRVQPENISVFWPPAGVMLAGFLLLPRNHWPTLASFLFLATLTANWLADRGFSLNLTLAVNDIAVSLCGAWLYQRLGTHDNPLHGLISLSRFVAIAIASAIASASVGAAIIFFFFQTPYWSVWPLWFGAMVLGIILVTPPILLARDFRPSTLENWQGFESAILYLIVISASTISFFDVLGHGAMPFVAALAPVPFLVWITLRRTPFESACLLLIASTIEIWGTALDHGPTTDIDGSLSERVFWLQTFLIIRAGTILFIGAAISARNRFERIAQERTAQLQSIIATIPDAIITIDKRGIVESFSASAERLFGYRATEVIGENVKMLMPSYYSERHDGYLNRYHETGERRIIGIGRLVVGQRKDGNTFPMELSVGETIVNGRQIFTGFVRDVSERQATERRLHELQDQMLHVTRLSAMGELASALAHELNQPLTAIKNYSLAGRQLSQTAAVDRGKLVEIMDKTVEQATRAGQIIRRLRAFVQKHDVERNSADINQVIEEASALAFIGLKEKSIRVTMERTAGLANALIDKVQIQQVLINLIRNAIDAMEGLPRRELTIRSTGGDEAIQVSVSDTGPGISDEVAERLFQPFVTTKATGMGVGLSISRTIVEAHGGQLWHEPNVGGGTIFHLTLPLHGGAETSK